MTAAVAAAPPTMSRTGHVCGGSASSESSPAAAPVRLVVIRDNPTEDIVVVERTLSQVTVCMHTPQKCGFSPSRYLPCPGSVQRIAHLRSLTERWHIIPLPGPLLPGCVSRHVAAWFQRRQKKRGDRNRFSQCLTDLCPSPPTRRSWVTMPPRLMPGAWA